MHQGRQGTGSGRWARSLASVSCEAGILPRATGAPLQLGPCALSVSPAVSSASGLHGRDGVSQASVSPADMIPQAGGAPLQRGEGTLWAAPVTLPSRAPALGLGPSGTRREGSSAHSPSAGRVGGLFSAVTRPRVLLAAPAPPRLCWLLDKDSSLGGCGAHPAPTAATAAVRAAVRLPSPRAGAAGQLARRVT